MRVKILRRHFQMCFSHSTSKNFLLRVDFIKNSENLKNLMWHYSRCTPFVRCDLFCHKVRGGKNFHECVCRKENAHINNDRFVIMCYHKKIIWSPRNTIKISWVNIGRKLFASFLVLISFGSKYHQNFCDSSWSLSIW
jgi:hypothetical protein